MTHIVEHQSFRYTWELVRHTYIVDSESEIEIRQVEISPSHENRLLDPPYPRTSFFEVEIDQIQKKGKTVFSLRNICPVQIKENPGLSFLNSFIKPGSSRVTKRFQLQEGVAETRWLYTDDFFLISLSSGDRHDLEMLISLVIGKLNMIALSIQSGKRIHSEFENQEKFRTVMSTMFSEGVDGAFRDVPVYQQHGDMTDSDIDVSAALVSAEFQDLMTVCASEEGAAVKITVEENTPVGSVAEGNYPAENTLPETMDAEPVTCETIPELNPLGYVTGKITVAESIPEDGTQTGIIREITTPPECIPKDDAQKLTLPEENTAIRTIPQGRCSSCGAGISATTKFCGSCGAAVSIVHPQESGPDYSRITDNSLNDSSPARSRPTAEPAVNLKSIEELEDLSWLSD